MHPDSIPARDTAAMRAWIAYGRHTERTRQLYAPSILALGGLIVTGAGILAGMLLFYVG